MSRIFSILSLLATALFLLAASSGDWRSRVPEKDAARTNPIAHDSDAAAVGAKLYEQYCATCHGRDAQGKSKHPSLHSKAVRDAAPGELQWLLTNGSLRRGMPSWSKLPEGQRWQLVAYLKTLQ